MKAFFIVVCLVFSFFAIAQVHVNGYYRSNGTYVAPYIRSSPNSTPTDNYSYPGNTNPYTGKTATGNPDVYIKNQKKSLTSTSNSDVWVDGYYKSDGTYVQGYYRSAPDENPYNNYSFPGNTNPYTGKTATGNSDTYLKKYNNQQIKTKIYSVKTSFLNVRSGPSTNDIILFSLNYGDNIEVIETTNTKWKKVVVYGTIGYVYSSYLSLTNPANEYFEYYSNTSAIYPNQAQESASRSAQKTITLKNTINKVSNNSSNEYLLRQGYYSTKNPTDMYFYIFADSAINEGFTNFADVIISDYKYKFPSEADPYLLSIKNAQIKDTTGIVAFKSINEYIYFLMKDTVQNAMTIGYYHALLGYYYANTLKNINSAIFEFKQAVKFDSNEIQYQEDLNALQRMTKKKKTSH